MPLSIGICKIGSFCVFATKNIGSFCDTFSLKLVDNRFIMWYYIYVGRIQNEPIINKRRLNNEQAEKAERQKEKR